MSAISDLLRVERDGSIALLALSHPTRRNVLSRDMLVALRDQFRTLASDAQLKCVILQAQGAVFSAGHDLGEIVGGSKAEREELFALCTEVMEAIRLLPVPVIAEVQGLATAAGCQLVATCDLAVAADTASFATPGVKIGLFCSTPAVALSRAIAAKPTLEMLFTGQAITAARALELGLVNRVVAAAELHEATLSLARQIATASADTLRRGKRAFYAQQGLSYPDAYGVAAPAMVDNAASPDAQEGMRAFLEKRSPRWQGE